MNFKIFLLSIVFIINIFVNVLASSVDGGKEIFSSRTSILSSHLISVEQLRQLIEQKEKDLVILSVQDKFNYFLGHIPQSRRVSSESIQIRVSFDNPVYGPYTSPVAFETFMQSLGVNDNSIVVIYDDSIGAAHLWWGLRFYGKVNVFLLNGGLRAWKEAKAPLEYFASKAEVKGNFLARKLQFAQSIKADKIEWAELKGHDYQLWDVRSNDEYQGKVKSHLLLRRGRIPNAKNLPWEKLRKSDGTFATKEEVWHISLSSGFDLQKKHIIYGNTPIEALEVFFALLNSGIPVEQLYFYENGLQEWAFEENRPMESSLMGQEGLPSWVIYCLVLLPFLFYLFRKSPAVNKTQGAFQNQA